MGQVKQWMMGCLLAGFSIVTGCGTPSSTEDELTVVPQGKADNYYSNVAVEYELTGKIPVSMTAEEYADDATRQTIVTERLTAVGLYLTAYLTEKFLGIDENGDGEITEDEIFFRNMGYGGFHAMARGFSAEPKDVVLVSEGQYEATFTMDAAGPKNMLTLIPGTQDPVSGLYTFELKMPAGASFTADYIPRGEFRSFDPNKYTGALDTILFSAKAHSQVGNSYPQFNAFFADGVYDITLFYGHDYNTSRSDLREAEEAFDALKSLRFTAPVQSFEQLQYDSGPFVKNIKSNGKSIRTEVRIFHSNMFEDNRQVQHDLALSETASRDVFFYLGHAGPYYGFYLDANDEAKVYYSEFATLPMDPNRQQLILANGCQTYSTYAEMLYVNPSKSEDNLDVVTTVNYSYGEGTMELFKSLISTDSSGNHKAVDYYSMISLMNSNWTNRSYEVFYGIMGIEGNPQLHPYANMAQVGKKCSSVSTCGNSEGNRCMKQTDGVKRCGAITLSALACPAGTTYKQLASGGTIVAGACF